jgi:hypothetical protein
MQGPDAVELTRALHEAGTPWVPLVLLVLVVVLAGLLAVAILRPQRGAGEKVLEALGRQQGAFFDRVEKQAKRAEASALEAKREAEAATRAVAECERGRDELRENHADCMTANQALASRVDQLEAALRAEVP